MPKFKYNPGDTIGPYNHILVKRLYKNESKKWVGEFECGWCHNPNTHFITTFDHMTRKNHEYLSCGCQAEKALQRKINRLKNMDKELVAKGAKKARAINSPYKIGTKWGHLTIEKETKKRDNAGNKIVLCSCDCGSNILEEYSTPYLYNSNNKRCCSLCKTRTNSKGELKIEEILKEKNINYIKEYSFDDCINPKTNYKLRFDFYLPDYNILIEYDGIQHFKVTGFSHEDFNERIEKDKIKNQYCKDNNIKLIRIPYTDFNILTTEYLINQIK